jgi:hypothetical protein
MATLEYWRSRVTEGFHAGSSPAIYYCEIDPAGARRTLDKVGVPMTLNIDQAAPIKDAFEDALRRFYTTAASLITFETERTELGPGEYYPRVWRGQYGPPPSQVCAEEWADSVAGARVLFAEMRAAFRYVEPHPRNMGAFGHELRQLLILACTELEGAWKGILGGAGSNTADYVRLVKPLRLDEWELALPLHPKLPPFRPFAGWHDP